VSKSATLYRMDMPEHLCPYGLKSRYLLKREGYTVDDHKLKSRSATERFKEKHHVDTTPQTFIDGARIGGYNELRKYFGKAVPDDKDTTYVPVIAVFAMALLMSLAISWHQYPDLNISRLIETFIALSMCVLAIQKLRDLSAFSLQFITYDLVAMRFIPYAYVYAVLEAFAGIAMLAQLQAWIVAPPALLIGSIGAVSVFKAVYLDKRELKCACVGGDSKVPLGFVSLTENLMMVAMGCWMFIK